MPRLSTARGACADYRCTELSRRRLLQVGGLGMLGMNLPALLQAAETKRKHPPARAKSVIFLFQWGGPSHVDLFDRKPEAPDGIRGPLASISSRLPGVPVCEGLPRVAKLLDRVTLIRTMTHTMKNHNSAGYYALTGHAPPSDDQRLRDSFELHPAFGSVTDTLKPGARDLPTFVAYPHTIRDGSTTPGQHASFLGKAHDPLFFTQDPNAADFGLPELTLPVDLPLARLQQRRELQKIVDEQARLLDHSATARGLDAYTEKALAMLQSPRLRQAFDLTRETAAMREAYGRTTYGQGCLLARRLVEAGVKFVTVYFSDVIGGQSIERGGWDTHGFNNTRMYEIIPKYHLPITDQTLPTLLTDLEQRGLLDSTLVIWMGEFGRTPRLNENFSRDHWPQCYTTLLAGGGVRRGYLHGASDKNGAYPARDPVRPDDLAATIFYLLGIDPATEVYAPGHRPVRIADGEPVLSVVG